MKLYYDKIKNKSAKFQINNLEVLLFLIEDVNNKKQLIIGFKTPYKSQHNIITKELLLKNNCYILNTYIDDPPFKSISKYILDNNNQIKPNLNTFWDKVCEALYKEEYKSNNKLIYKHKNNNKDDYIFYFCIYRLHNGDVISNYQKKKIIDLYNKNYLYYLENNRLNIRFTANLEEAKILTINDIKYYKD